jgi:non-ribosomal peptide synthetase component F
VLLAGFVALLQRYSGQGEVVIGTPIANRNRAEIEGLIGFFVNMLVLRVKVGEEMSYEELVKEVREVCLGAYEHQDLPFEKLVEELQPERDPGRNPLFQVTFVELNALETKHHLGKASEVSAIAATSEATKFDLQIDVKETQGILQVLAEYSSDLYEEETIRRMLGHYERLLRSAVADPKRRIGELELLSAEERGQLVEEWNATEVQYEREKIR